MILIGFTGSREEPSKQQRKWLLEQALSYGTMGTITQWHHGCCKGSDEFSHRVAKSVEAKIISLHPPKNPAWEMEYTEWDYKNCVWFPKKPYLARDRDIVDCAMEVLATPYAEEAANPRSGTWYTIRQAIARGRKVYICYRNGKVEVK